MECIPSLLSRKKQVHSSTLKKIIITTKQINPQAFQNDQSPDKLETMFANIRNIFIPRNAKDVMQLQRCKGSPFILIENWKSQEKASHTYSAQIGRKRETCMFDYLNKQWYFFLTRLSSLAVLCKLHFDSLGHLNLVINRQRVTTS